MNRALTPVILAYRSLKSVNFHILLKNLTKYQMCESRRLWAWLSPSILELEKVSAHVNRSDFRQNFIGQYIWPLEGTISEIVAARPFLTCGHLETQSRRSSGLPLLPEGSQIYKNTRELFETGSFPGHFGVLIFEIRRLSYFAQKFD